MKLEHLEQFEDYRRIRAHVHTSIEEEVFQLFQLIGRRAQCDAFNEGRGVYVIKLIGGNRQHVPAETLLRPPVY